MIRRSNAGKVDFMAGIAAGVVTEAQVNGMPSTPTKLQTSLASTATWSYIWTGAALVYLLGIYLGFITLTRRAQ
jgi:hypothetical protein